MRSSPAIVDGYVYVGSGDASLYVLDGSDGSQQWRLGTGDPIESAPAVVDGVVYVGSTDNNLYALVSTVGS